ncbi:MAG: ABC transporter permease subunit [Anaerolineae bacterium]|nr:ABC transporter permease subunit [Anaerolineae bacterium]
MTQALILEFKKARGRKIWMIVAAMTLVEIIWTLWGTSRMDEHDLAQGWESVLLQYPVINSIIMPVMAAVVASRVCDVEHKGQTLKLLETLMPAGRIFDAKFLFSNLYMITAVMIQIISMVVVGCLKGFAGNPPMDKLACYLLFTGTVNMTLLLLQQILSLQFANQMVSLSVGLLGGLMSIFLFYLPKVFSNFFLWGYYAVLTFVEMDWNPATRIVNYYYISENWSSFILLLGAFTMLYLIGRRLFIRKEI